MDTPQFKPVEFVKNYAKTAKIEVNANKVSSVELNRLLFGKFTEHLGRNVYNGIWAQILQNPSFSAWHFFLPLYKEFKEKSFHWAKDFPVDQLQTAYEKGVACWWIPYGTPECSYLISIDKSVNTDTAQQIVVKNKSIETGVMQPVYLPVHRQRSYTLTFFVCGTVKEIYVSITKQEQPVVVSSIKGIRLNWKQFKIKFTVPEGKINPGELVYLKMGVKGPATVWFDEVFLFPDDNIDGFDPDVIKLLSATKITILRFPGGCFASNYHWKDGIGPLHNRPVKINHPWGGIEPNYIGTDEWMKFCRLIGAEPFICVNIGNGTPREAADWVSYCNSPVSTPWGKLRAQNGHPEPYRVKYWELGNEVYLEGETGFCTVAEYSERYTAFRTSMLAVDPDILPIAIGYNQNWSKTLLSRKKEMVRSLSLHPIFGVNRDKNINPVKTFQAFMAYTAGFDKILTDLRHLADTYNQKIKIAITELHIMTRYDFIPNCANLSEVLFYAGIIHSAVRQGNLVELITHTAIVNHGGGLRKVKEIVYPNPVHWVSYLYGNLPAAYPIKTQVSSGTFNGNYGGILSVKNAPVIDTLSLISKTGKQLILLIINRDVKKVISTEINITGFKFKSTVTVKKLCGKSFLSQNTWDKPDEVKIETTDIMLKSNKFKLNLPPHSLTVLFLHKADN